MINYLIDTHAHLEMKQFDNDRRAVVARARQAGVGIITVGIDLESSARAVQLANEYGIYAAVGIHPHEARRYSADLPGTMGELEKLSQDGRVVALGEMGLDYYRNYSPREDQLKLLREQLRLAERLGKPVVVHDRQADKDILTILKGAGVRGVVHSFSSSAEIAEELLDLGFYLGFGGPLTFPQARQRHVVKKIPLERILVETDAPFLTPAPHRGRRNESAYVRYVAQVGAELKGISLDDVAERTTRNAEELFVLC